MLLRIAFRNLWLHRLRTLIVGGILTFGTVLVIVGNAVLDAIDAGMERSIVHSIAGHLQVFSDDAKDELQIFGAIGMAEQDIGRIDDYAAVEAALAELDNVAAVVPMGQHNSIVFGSNLLERKLRDLRQAVEDRDAARVASLKAHVRSVVAGLEEDLSKVGELAADDAADPQQLEALERVQQDAFWQGFDEDPVAALELLDTRVAPLVMNPSMYFLRYIGTDPDRFAETFELFEIVDGQAIPEGERGLLLNKSVYEKWIKDRTARRLDDVKEARETEGRRIADDESLQTLVRYNREQVASLLREIDPDEAQALATALREALGASDTELPALLTKLLDTTDANFDRHYAIFYEHVAPRIPLYAFPVGSEMTITSFTRAGYVRSVNLKVWGTYQFRSLEKSALAGGHHLMDLVSFRELYGFVTAEQQAEIAVIKDKAGAQEVARAEAEDVLFGEDAELVDETERTGFDEFQGAQLAGVRAEAEARSTRFTRADLYEGPALNVAVLLKDPARLPETRAAIERIADERGLGLQTRTWHEASGLVGQMVTSVRLVLYVAVAIIFIVALVILNNTMVMATMERVREIGTIRAIGGQRGFILRLFLLETLLLGLVFGVVGALAGGGLVTWMGTAGLPASHDILYFLFAGPALYPTLTVGHVVGALSLILVVGLLSTFYPAVIATRITPIEAMNAKEAA